MASSLASTSTAAVTTTTTTTKSARLSHSPNSFSFSLRLLSPKPKPKPKPKPNSLRFFTNKGCPPGHMVVVCPTRIKAHLNEVALDGSSNAVPPAKPKSDVEPPTKPSIESSSSVLATEESISQFIAQVSSLVKLVDSRDIVELKLKQMDIEVTIRKKEAMPQLQSAPQPAMVYSPPSQTMPSVAPESTPASPTLSQSTSTPAVKSPKSSHAPLKSPMPGTFYRSPGPGEPPFVNIGDKVKKGQVVCIVEAMKLMNEIEANQSGTVVEIVAEDGKPVSVDSPLFVIEPES